MLPDTLIGPWSSADSHVMQLFLVPVGLEELAGGIFSPQEGSMVSSLGSLTKL
jgi:hypothetical protein